jgi:uncharacterized protein YuzE
MRVTYDPSAGAAYIYIVDTISRGEARQSVAVHDGDVMLDLDANGRLLGIEILGAERLLRPETLAAAERLG